MRKTVLSCRYSVLSSRLGLALLPAAQDCAGLLIYFETWNARKPLHRVLSTEATPARLSGGFMTRKHKFVVLITTALSMAVFTALALLYPPTPAEAGLPASHYQVLSPITHGNLTIFPVVAFTTHDTHEFLTLDEGLRSGEVEVTEHGGIRPMVRRPNTYHPTRGSGAEVNKLYLINNS